MADRIFELKHIFGLKLKEIRMEMDITYHQLSERSGLSVSYLSEIESGKKYPKGDKILKLAEALEVSYDDLVSLKVPKKLQPVIDLIESNFIKDFPLDTFGISTKKLIEIVSHDPAKANAFISTIMRIAHNFELRQEQFYVAALRSYRELHNNYFEELEFTVEQLHLEFTELKDIPFQPEILEDILLKVGVRTDFEKLSKIKSLRNLRSLYHPKERLLMINKGLTKGQKNFLLGREIAFQWMKMKNRPLDTPWSGSPSFEALLNNFFASYFSAALIIPKEELMKDIGVFGAMGEWDTDFLPGLIDKYEATPEMIMQRLTNLLPTYFDFRNLYFLRIVKSGGRFNLTKELYLDTRQNLSANELNEHYCRRWSGIGAIHDLEEQIKVGKSEIVSRAQISHFQKAGNEYFELSMAFPNVSNEKESISVGVGFLMDDALKKHLNLVNSAGIPRKEVNVTCERCNLTDCKERAWEPVLERQNQERKEIRDKIESLLAS